MRGGEHPKKSGKRAAFRRRILVLAASSVFALVACDRERRSMMPLPSG